MTTTTGSGLSELHELVLYSIVDELIVKVKAGCDQLTPAELRLLVEDACIDNCCRVCELPKVAGTLYTDACNRLNDPNYGCYNFSLKSLVDSVKRAL